MNKQSILRNNVRKFPNFVEHTDLHMKKAH